MIYPHSDLKFQVTATQPDFQLTEDDFTIVIKDRYGRIRQTIRKNDCFYDSDGRFYFTVEDVRRGIYYAFFEGSYEDDDYTKQKRVFTDAQELYRVGYCGGCKCKCPHVVHYEQVWTVSIDGEDYLCDCDGRYILTSDNKRICFKNDKATEIEDMGKVRLKTMKGEEFVRLIEDFDPNSEVDTIPEVMHALQGISDDETVRDDVQEQMADNSADHTDIDDIFDD